VDGTPMAGGGPSWKGVFGHMVTMTDGKQYLADENYIRESILNPQAKIVMGFEGIMPTYQGLLRERELNSLIAFIKSLKN
jgi:cytochrome c oxidase subunit 2